MLFLFLYRSLAQSNLSFSSACDANMFAFCFSSNNFSDDLELVKDLDGLDELWDFELFLDFQDLEDKDDLGLLSFDWELRWVFDGIFL